MASTYSSSLNLELQTTGENSGSWGTKTNNNLQKLESAIKGYVSVAIASTSDSLTASDGGTGDEKWTGKFDIAQVQFERGSDATQFDLRTPQDELKRCQRYYQKSINHDVVPGSDYESVGAGGVWSSTGVAAGTTDYADGHVSDDAVAASENSANHRGYNMPGVVNGMVGYGAAGPSIHFKTTMRATPEVLIYNPDDGTRGRAYNAYFDNGSGGIGQYQSMTIPHIEGIGTNGVNSVITSGSDYSGNIDTGIHSAKIIFYWTADAEI